jgi:hypothetical protein
MAALDWSQCASRPPCGPIGSWWSWINLRAGSLGSASIPKNQSELIQLSDCRRLPGAKSGDPNSYVFGRVATIPNTKRPGTVPPLRTRGFPYGLMTLFYLRAGYAEVILILDLPLLPAC